MNVKGPLGLGPKIVDDCKLKTVFDKQVIWQYKLMNETLWNFRFIWDKDTNIRIFNYNDWPCLWPGRLWFLELFMEEKPQGQRWEIAFFYWVWNAFKSIDGYFS